MSSIKINPRELAVVLRKEDARLRKAVSQAANAAARKLKTYMVRETDRKGITDRGIYKSSFVVNKNVVSNEAPHAGIVEMGTRPHFVGKEGREALALWCMRKLGLTYADAQSASWAIAHKIAEVGTEGRYVFRDALPKAVEFFQQELARIIKRNIGRKP